MKLYHQETLESWPLKKARPINWSSFKDFYYLKNNMS